MIDDKAIMAAANKYNSDKGLHEEMENILHGWRCMVQANSLA